MIKFVDLENLILFYSKENETELLKIFNYFDDLFEKYNNLSLKYTYYSIGVNFSLLRWHLGQRQSSGSSSHFVPTGMSCFGSPFAGSYSYPHTLQTYFSMVFEGFMG